jgi:single-stranded-DNA-specific exonuclease
MDIRTLENRAILNIGMKNFQNKALLTFVEGIEKPGQEESSFSRKVETPTDVSFNFVPLINSVVRMGTQEDKKMLFDAFSEIYSEYQYKNPRTKEEKIENIYERVFRLCKNTKAKQDKETVKALDSIKKDIEENNRNRHKILFCKAGDDVDKSLSGLCAIKLANEYNKPVVLLREGKGAFLSGSIRNFDGSPLKKLKTFLESFGYVNWIQGHENSAGIAMTTNQIQKLIPLVNKKLENYSFEKKYILDFEYNINELNSEMLEEIYSMRYYYAQGLRKSLMMVKNINFNSGEIEFLGKSVKNTWKIKIKDNLDLIKFKINNSDELYEKFSEDSLFNWNNQKMTMNAIVEVGVNEWNGNKKWQLVVLEYVIVNQENNNESEDGW